ncbi:MAG: ArsR/SmtB family transcription factor [Sciscionella sp.]
MDGEKTDRLRRLEARVTALEASSVAHMRPDPVPPEDEQHSARFWALRELEDRADGRSPVLFTGSVTLKPGEHYEWQQEADGEVLLDTDLSSCVDVLAALAHPARLVIVQSVLQGIRTAKELTELEELGTTGQVYHHLRQLVAVGWLRLVGRGRYEVPATRVVPLLVVLAAAQR